MPMGKQDEPQIWMDVVLELCDHIGSSMLEVGSGDDLAQSGFEQMLYHNNSGLHNRSP
jgi:hypothetical protein